MGLADSIRGFLNVPSADHIKKLEEELATKDLLLKNSEEELLAANPVTFTSSMAREIRATEDPQGLVIKRVSVKELQLLYLNNQFIFRGVNVRADELVTRGYSIIGKDEKGVEKCEKLIADSGGINLIWQLSVNTDVAGDGYLELIPNQAKNAILKLKPINPINFGFKTVDKNRNQIEVDKNGEPTSYEQCIFDQEGKEVRTPVPKDRVAHLKFNTFGDEFNGISSIQPVYNTAIRLMNMEHSAAEAAVRTANPTWVVMTESKSPQDLNRWANVMGRVSGKEVVFTPQGVKIDLKSPGNQNFSDYADYFLDAVVAALGVPKSILTGSSDASGGNRATMQTLSRHFTSIVRANQRYVEELFNDIFRRYGKLAGFEPPLFIFNDIAEDADRNGQRAIELYKGGLATLVEARDMIGLDTTDEIEAELRPLFAPDAPGTPGQPASKIDPGKEAKAQDMKTWHPATPGKTEGSQKGIKKAKKFDSSAPQIPRVD